MDLSYRRAQQAFHQNPYSTEALLDYWAARIRAGLTIGLEELKPDFSCDPLVESFIRDHSDYVAVYNLSLLEFRELLTNRIEQHLEDPQLKAQIYYLGWLPQLFDLNNSGDEFIRDQEVANGAFVLAAYPSSNGLAISGFYFSIFFTSDHKYITSVQLEIDLESIVINGPQELVRLQINSCKNIGPLQTKQSIGLLQDLDEYTPLIEIIESPYSRKIQK